MAQSAAMKTTVQRQSRDAAAAQVQQALEHTGDPWKDIDVQVAYDGQKIVLPDTPVKMDLDVAIDTISRIRDEAEQRVTVNESVDAFPKDGAVALHKAMRELFGWTSAVPTPGFFGPEPPTTIDVDIGPHEKIAVVWGRFELPGVEGHVQCGGIATLKGPRFMIGGEVKRKHHHIIRRLADITRRIAAEESIYRNKAIQLTVTESGQIDWHDGILFTDLSGVVADELVFSETTEVQIKTSLWTLIEQTERCRLHKVPLKRGVLMAGRYGTGKSLTSAVTALKAVENGWTFLSIGRVSGLSAALHFARKYQPCVIFAEDIDRVISGEERDIKIDDVLNAIDGIESKGTEIMVVLTTNHVEKINRAMLRPGRLDAVIEVTAPDPQAVKRLVRLYGRSMIDENDPLDRCSEALAGQIPAMIRECTERAKLYAIARSNSDRGLKITDEDVFNSAVGMRPHMDLLEAKVEVEKDPTFREIIEQATLSSMEEILETAGESLNVIRVVGGRVQGVEEQLQRMSNGRAATR